MTKFVVKDSATKKCLHCPWRNIVDNGRGGVQFDVNSNGVGGQHFCELRSCENYENQKVNFGITFKQRHVDHQTNQYVP